MHNVRKFLVSQVETKAAELNAWPLNTDRPTWGRGDRWGYDYKYISSLENLSIEDLRILLQDTQVYDSEV